MEPSRMDWTALEPATKLHQPLPDSRERDNLVDRCPAGQRAKTGQNDYYNTSGGSKENEHDNKLARAMLNRGPPSEPARDVPV